MKFNSGNSIGLLGGTFDPFHLGHAQILKALIGKFDQIALIPTGDPWMKPEKPVASAKQRLEMCQVALDDLADELQEKVFLLDIEVERKGAENALLLRDFITVALVIHVLDVLRVLLAGELRRVDADHHELLGVFVFELLELREDMHAVNAAIRPKIQDHNMPL